MLQKLIDFHIATGIQRLKEHHGGQLPAEITLDLDATDDATHGQQQLTLFHGYYGQFQYFPLIISEPVTKHVFVAWLRPGTAHASIGSDDDLLRVVAALRKQRSPRHTCACRRRLRPAQDVRGLRTKQPHLHLRILHQRPAQDTPGRTDETGR